jgi:hypothetical protein
MKNIALENWSRARRIAFVVFCVALFLGAFIPLLVNLLVNGHFDWSIIVLGAIVMAWLILAPWFALRRSRAAISWAAAAVSVPIFLWIVESLGTNKGWLLPVGLPAAVTALAAWGGIVWLWNRSRLKIWYATALTFILIGLLSLAEYLIARPYLPWDPSFAVRQIATLCVGGVSLLLSLIAFLAHKFKPFKDLPG